MYYTLLIVFFLSRLFFINTGDVFFDSGENISLLSDPNYFHAIVSGHFPPHVGYIILFWPLFQLAKLASLNPTFFVILGQIILATITIVCFYNIIKFITEKRTAIIASIIASILPIFWISNVTVMMETVYISFFFISFYFLVKYLSVPKKFVYINLSAFCFTFSFLTHILIVFWLPLLFAIVFYKKKSELTKVLLMFISYLTVGSILNVSFISLVSKESIEAVIRHLYFTKGNEFAYIPINFYGLLITARNFLIPLFRNNSILIVLLAFISFISLYLKNKKYFFIGFLWTLPALYLSQWWDSLLNGRHALITSFGLAFLTAYLIRKKIVLIFFVVIYLLIISVPTLNLLRKPIPYIQEANFVKSLPKDSLLIETHFAKPQVEKTYKGKLLAVNDPLSGKELIRREIDNYLSQNKPVFISSGALSEPYGLYSGPYLHNITLSYAKSFELESVIKNYRLEKYKEINIEDNLIIYKITSKNLSPYPKVKSLKTSHRRLDYYDPIARFIFFGFL